MSSSSPTAEGFRLIFRRPVIPLAEIAWRWACAAALWFLSASFLVQYADSLRANKVDRLLLGTHQPALILRALHRIAHGSALRFTAGGIVLAIGLAIAWILLSSLGRAATLKAMMAELGIISPPNPRRGMTSPLLGLNSLRIATALAAIVGAFGTVFIASGVWASTHLSTTDSARLWLALLFLVWTAWAMLNWLLSTAAIFVATDRMATFPAISTAVGWSCDRMGSVLAAGIWFGLIRGGAFLSACGAALTVLSVAQVLGSVPTLFLEFLIVAIYCAVADWLYIGRLTAYLAIIRGGDALDLPEPQLPPRLVAPDAPASIDQSELILSDVPLLAT